MVLVKMMTKIRRRKRKRMMKMSMERMKKLLKSIRI